MSRRSGRPAAVLCAAVLLAGCAQTPSASLSDADRDPWEPMNRGTHAFNEKFDQWVFEPIAIGWDFVVPELVQEGLQNFFENLAMPVVIANDVLQLKPSAVGEDLLRLFANTVFGLGGFIDVASRVEIAKNDEGFGQTLGWWGVPPGPYLVLPFLGPSTPREVAGLGVDSMGAIYPWFVPIYVSFVANGVELVNLRSVYLDEIRQNRADAFDYYVFIRNAYLQNLEKKTRDAEETPAEVEEDLYYFDDEEFEDE
ncbi:MAG: MlaA family lipoprotein [Myxococcota bacterium]